MSFLLLSEHTWLLYYHSTGHNDSFTKKVSLLLLIFHMHVGKGQIAGMKVRGQPEGISFLLPSGGSQTSNTRHQVWWQAPSSSVPLHRLYFVDVFIVVF